MIKITNRDFYEEITTNRNIKDLKIDDNAKDYVIYFMHYNYNKMTSEDYNKLIQHNPGIKNNWCHANWIKTDSKDSVFVCYDTQTPLYNGIVSVNFIVLIKKLESGDEFILGISINPINIEYIKSLKFVIGLIADRDSYIDYTEPPKFDSADKHINIEEHQTKTSHLESVHEDLIKRNEYSEGYIKNEPVLMDDIKRLYDEVYSKNSGDNIDAVDNWSISPDKPMEIKYYSNTIRGAGIKNYNYYNMFFHWNQQEISRVLSSKNPEFSYDMLSGPFLGFSSSNGTAFLYGYIIKDNKIFIAIAGSNSQNTLDFWYLINDDDTVLNADKVDNDIQKVVLNRFYNVIYFVLNNNLYFITGDNNTVTKNVIYLLKNGSKTVARDYSNDNLKIWMLENAGKIIPTTYQDLGDVVINNINDNFYYYSLINGETASYMNSELLNTYSINNRMNKSNLMNVYKSSVLQLNYCMNNNINPIFVDSDKIVCDISNGYYKILFKNSNGYIENNNIINRVIIDPTGLKIIGSDYLIYNDKITSIYGEKLENSDTFFNMPLKYLVDSKRGLTVVKKKPATNISDYYTYWRYIGVYYDR